VHDLAVDIAAAVARITALVFQLCGDVDGVTRFAKDHLVVIIVLVIIDIDAALYIHFILLPGDDPDGVGDLEIHAYITAGGEVDVLFDDPLRPCRQQADAEQEDEYAIFHDWLILFYPFLK
jgi:hypothetical protein